VLCPQFSRPTKHYAFPQINTYSLNCLLCPLGLSDEVGCKPNAGDATPARAVSGTEIRTAWLCAGWGVWRCQLAIFTRWSAFGAGDHW